MSPGLLLGAAYALLCIGVVIGYVACAVISQRPDRDRTRGGD